MARGWESKSVESQQDDARQRASPRVGADAADHGALARRRTLELAVAETQAALQSACRPAHREMLQLRLDALRAELGTLGQL